MKNLVALTLLAALFSPFARAEKVPTIPADCFDGQTYCYGSKVTQDADNRRVIRVSLFARLDATTFTKEQLLEKFFDFAHWPSYAEDSSDISFISSREITSTVVNGQTVRRHQANYKTKAPFPFMKLEVYEIANYFQLPTYEGALLSYKFVADLTQPGSKGLKHKVGLLHLGFDQATNEHVVYLTIDVVPSIDLLPTVAAPYIERAMMGIFLGMFDLN